MQWFSIPDARPWSLPGDRNCRPVWVGGWLNLLLNPAISQVVMVYRHVLTPNELTLPVTCHWVGNSDFGLRFLGGAEFGIPLPISEFREFFAGK
jgi:hypothetical protein